MSEEVEEWASSMEAEVETAATDGGETIGCSLEVKTSVHVAADTNWIRSQMETVRRLHCSRRRIGAMGERVDTLRHWRRKCAVDRCLNNDADSPAAIRFFSFPRELQRAERWAELCKPGWRPRWRAHRHSVVCSAHFSPAALLVEPSALGGSDPTISLPSLASQHDLAQRFIQASARLQQVPFSQSQFLDSADCPIEQSAHSSVIGSALAGNSNPAVCCDAEFEGIRARVGRVQTQMDELFSLVEQLFEERVGVPAVGERSDGALLEPTVLFPPTTHPRQAAPNQTAFERDMQALHGDFRFCAKGADKDAWTADCESSAALSRKQHSNRLPAKRAAQDVDLSGDTLNPLTLLAEAMGTQTVPTEAKRRRSSLPPDANGPFQCELCGERQFDRYIQLCNHLRKCGKREEAPTTQDDSTTNELRPGVSTNQTASSSVVADEADQSAAGQGAFDWTCSYCGAGFTRPQSLSNHVRIHLPDSAKVPRRKPGEAAAERLAKAVAPKPRPVMVGPRARLVCPVCGNDYRSRKTLLAHTKRAHGYGQASSARHSCRVCGRVCFNSRMLHAHMARVHSCSDQLLLRPTVDFQVAAEAFPQADGIRDLGSQDFDAKNDVESESDEDAMCKDDELTHLLKKPETEEELLNRLARRILQVPGRMLTQDAILAQSSSWPIAHKDTQVFMALDLLAGDNLLVGPKILKPTEGGPPKAVYLKVDLSEFPNCVEILSSYALSPGEYTATLEESTTGAK